MTIANFEVIGSGSVGDKARQLMEKTPKLNEIGFYTPHRTVLAEGYFDGFFQRNNLGNSLREVEINPYLEDKVRKGSLTREEFEVLCRVCHQYGDSPLAVRSSAEGDSRGTGTYKSVFTENDVNKTRKSVKRVLRSYFTEDAVLFRKDANTGDGFGIMIEPIIGQDIDFAFAPVLSGFGYTSTSRGDGYVNIVPGLGGGVDTKDGEKITEDKLREFNGNLMDYAREKRHSMFGMFGAKVRRRSALLRTDHDFPMFNRGSYSAKAFLRGDRNGACNCSLTFDDEILRGLEDLDMSPLFEMMKRMEDSFGKPQYFEWAMTLENGKPVYWITQVADVSKKLDTFDFEDLGGILFTGHTITGSGIKTCCKIADCWNPDDVEPLYNFNQQNENYVLLFSSRMTTAALSAHIRSIRYRDFSNASVLLEIQDARHLGDTVSHLGGQAAVTGKFVGVLDYDADPPPQWDKVRAKEIDEYGMRVYQGKLKVIASEKQNKMVVSATD